jgi:hypothetical protein
MEKSLQIDSSGNFIIVNDQWSFCTTLSEYVAQKLQIRLKKFMGEYFLDGTNDGIPYLSYFEKNFDVSVIDSKIKIEILEEKHVIGITKFSSVFDSAQRTYAYEVTVQLSNNTSLIFSSLQALGGLIQ